jgi:hypothetical protein
MGYANEDLRSWDRRQPWPELVKQALAGLLEYNGYYDFTDALEDTIGAVRERLGAEAVPTGTRGA